MSPRPQRRGAPPTAAAVALASALGLGVASLAIDRAPARSPGPSPEPAGESSEPGSASTGAIPVRGGDAAPRSPSTPPDEPLPVERWSERFATRVASGDWAALLADLDELEERSPGPYRAHNLGYLHARAALEAGDGEQARSRLAPYLAPGPFRPLALRHAAVLAEAEGEDEEAAARRRQLLRDHPSSPYWSDTLSEQIAWSLASAPPEATLEMVQTLLPRAEGRQRRDLAAARVAALARLGQDGRVLTEAQAMLAGSTQDDAAERVAEVLDRPDLLGRLSPESVARLGQALHHHRRWDRAIELLALARRRLPADRAAELDFAMGRSHYFAERFGEARELYLRAAGLARSDADRARYLYHAGRAAQLLGEDEDSERLLTRAIAVRGSHDATASALVGRLRARVARGDLAAALRDLQLLRRDFPKRGALTEGAVAFALGELAAGRPRDALDTLGKLEPARLSAHERAEVAYWRGRALAAAGDTDGAVDAYLAVLRGPAASRFAAFARRRLAEGELAGAAAARAGSLRAEAKRRLAAGDAATARPLQTDATLLSGGAEADVALLADVYRALPDYRRFLELSPRALPSLPLEDPERDELLAALGLFDEAGGWLVERYPLSPPESALARSLAYRLGGSTRASIQAAESLAAQAPDGFLPAMLPRLLRELLYPRSYAGAIAREAERAGADPTLVLAIMREESRFNPRAKSGAAARGLLQLLLSTAREVAWDLGLVEIDPEDLYDPAMIIRLGAGYVGDLQEEFGGDLYATTAAYNAGPAQTHLWRRLAPAPGADFFVSTVGFAETRGYVRKVLDSYDRYSEIYDATPAAAAAGVHARP